MKNEKVKNLENKVNETLHITCRYLGTLALAELVQGQYPEKWEQMQDHYFSSEGNDYYFVLREIPGKNGMIYRTSYCPQQFQK